MQRLVIGFAPPAPPITGLDFVGNVQFPASSLGTSSILVWNSTVLGGTAPPPAYPATYIWKAFPRLNPTNTSPSSFWTFLFWAGYETGAFSQTNGRYYGMHPYPNFEAGGTNMWEISAYGADSFVDPVVFDQWYTQVVTTELVGGTEFYTYYWDWPNLARVVTTTGAQRPVPADPAIIIGDAPWNRGFEAPNAILRGWQFYDALLSEAQINSELATPGAVRTPWYLNLNPTPTDVTDKSGLGHHPVWVDANRPGLWTP